MSMGFIPKLICAAIIALPSYLPVPNQEQTVLAEIKENQQDITLSATTKSVPGMYCGIAFTWNNRTKIFPWESISEPAFYPEVMITNIDDKLEKVLGRGAQPFMCYKKIGPKSPSGTRS